MRNQTNRPDRKANETAPAGKRAAARLEVHPAALIFPPLEREEFAELVRSMRLHGYDRSKPITLHEGKILDGCNRYRAAQEAGIEPIFADWAPMPGDSPLLFALRTNLSRRHLTEGQKAMVALEAEKLLAEEAKDRQRMGKENFLTQNGSGKPATTPPAWWA